MSPGVTIDPDTSRTSVPALPCSLGATLATLPPAKATSLTASSRCEGSITRPPRRPLSLAALIVAALGCVFQASAARALDEGAGEAKAIDACDKRLCTILQQKNPSGEDLKCLLTKTWAKSSLKGDRSVGWGFGDARCTVQIDISRARIVATVTDKDTKFSVPAHTAHCIVEQDGELKTVKATLAPKIVFKGGKAEKIWINLLHVEGPTAIKATMTTAAQLNDTISLS